MRVLREAAGLGQRELSRRAGLGVNAVSQIEGEAQSPRLDTLDAILTALGVGLDELARELRRAQGADVAEVTADEVAEATSLAPDAADDAVLDLVTRSLETQQQLLAALVRRKRS